MAKKCLQLEWGGRFGVSPCFGALKGPCDEPDCAVQEAVRDRPLPDDFLDYHQSRMIYRHCRLNVDTPEGRIRFRGLHLLDFS